MVSLSINNFKENLDSLDSSAVAKVSAAIKKREYEFINMLSDTNIVDKVVEAVGKMSPEIDTMVVVGIGGSDLGGRALQQALDKLTSPIEVFFTGDTTDPVALAGLVSELEIENTVFNIVSKSGRTTETMAHYLFFKKQVRQINPTNWQDHFIFTTDDDSGLLFAEANRHKIAKLDIPDEVGGRFSVLSAVGLLPAAAMELDIIELLKGAADAAADFLQDPEESISHQIAAYQFAHQPELGVSVIMPYSVQLNEFARWYRQLWAESLGKEGEGIMPVQAFGPADQHSQLQLYNEGNNIATYLFLKVRQREASLKIENVDIKELSYLEGVDFADLINVELDATQTSLTNQGRPNMTLDIDQVDAYHMGQLFVIFEIAVVVLAEMFGVNAFNQPGVEESKQEMYKRLGK